MKKAAQEAVKLMVEKGYRHIAFVCPSLEISDDQNIYTHEQCLEGFFDYKKKFDKRLQKIPVDVCFIGE